MVVGMKLSEYAQQEGIGYRAAWIRYRKNQIPGAYQTDHGRIVVPDPEEKLRQRCAIYSRVSTYKQKDDLDRQEDRLKTLATQRGYEIAESVKEIGSGVNDRRAKLVRLLNTPTWGTLIIEHRDRLSRVGFGWFETFLSLLGKEIIVADQTEESDEGRVEDILSLMYTYAASEYGRRGARNRAERARKELDRGEGS